MKSAKNVGHGVVRGGEGRSSPRRPAFATFRLAALLAAGASIFGVGCGDEGVFFATGGGAGSTTSSTGGQGGTTTSGGSAGTTQGGGGTGGTTQGGGGTGGTTQGGGGTGGGTGGTTMAGECTVAGDCDGVKSGPPACGSWACNAGVCQASSLNCTDGDGDGYGAGAGCACNGIDCDDADASVHATSSKPCYTGPNGTQNTGVCHTGTSTCTSGVWSPCGGEVTPSGEACNNQDDDCDGTVDDGLGSFTCGLGFCQATVPACTNGIPGVCKPGAASSVTDASCDGVDSDCDGPIDEDCGCIAVAQTGDDVAGLGTFLLPFKTIQKAINFAVANPNGPQTVCVAGGANCTAAAPYFTGAGATITMANGVSVIGSYNPSLASWIPCQTITTTLQPQTAEGVVFPATVQKTTVLSGFTIERLATGAAGTTAGVTVNGAKNALLTNVSIQNSPDVMNSYGVDVKAGGDVKITKSAVGAGHGSAESIAVRSVGSKVALKDNCTMFDNNNRCISGCFNAATQLASIAGRTPQGTGTTYGVLLQDSPGSSIETSALCRIQADNGAMIRITGDGTGILIRGNQINAFQSVMESHGIYMEDCNDAAPWIVDNASIAANGVNNMSNVNAIRAVGACHPVIDSNVQIVGGGEGNSANPIGVYCGKNLQGVASQCVILNNARIAGSLGGFPMSAIGVKCDDGGCNRIANNVITGRGGSPDSVGLSLGSTGTSVENNVIRGGCSAKAIGVRANDAYGRLENNRIFGYDAIDCSNGAPNVQESYGLRMFVQAGAHELDVHSNDIDGGGPPPGGVVSCSSRGVVVDLAMGAVTAKHGIFRNNILRAGTCQMSRVTFFEALAGADPRIVENNDFDPTGAPSALYWDEGTTALTTAAEVNLLGDITTASNISIDPLYTAYPNNVHLQAGSMCIDAGTTVGAPAKDMDGALRDASPDIGADEH